MSIGPIPESRSRLDTDLYQFTMGQYLFRRYRNVCGVDRFVNRTHTIALQHIIREEDLRQKLDLLQVLPWKTDELDYLANYRTDSGNTIFREDYLRFLEELILPDYELEFREDGIDLSFPGPICETGYWETPALADINELYTDAYLAKLPGEGRLAIIALGTLRLLRKIRLLQGNPRVVFSDYGTRRRFSLAHHEMVVDMLKDELPSWQFIGTSNVWLAKKYNLRPIGTMAHRLFMAMSRIVPQNPASIRGSHQRVLEEWWDEYGYDLSILLPDTFGRFGLDDITEDMARKCKGIRIDSGDPAAECEAAVQMFCRHGADPLTKMVVPSDSLDVETMIRLADTFKHVKISFGIGTNMTNDCGIPNVSIVIKLAEVNGLEVAKLSNNVAKATGSSAAITEMKEIFGYTNTYSKECRY